ncbi:rIIB protein [Caulobacter phage Seuss]|uniref:RIIB protein n=1 Tax=Caulobacter phage Seuss TaxID=1675601 RepID=A0A0K1LM67_9CAUD|nr:RIIB lysis inhibitor [Caulobacter phage Seuss]AKU43612.1 rIIB protein [Caulobacter phage Seuss]
MALISIISEDSATVFVGGKPFIIHQDHARYEDLKAAIAAGDEAKVEQIALAAESFSKLLGTYGDVQVFGGHITFQGRQITNYLVNRILELMALGMEPSSHALFLDRAMRNPNKLAEEYLYKWVERAQMPLLPDGRFCAWKIIRGDYTDKHTGTFDNSPGVTLEMPREKVNPDMNQQCSTGFHFCGPSYFPSFHNSGDRIVLLAVDPIDVVSFPQDGGGTKGRACKYEILFEVDGTEAAKSWFKGKDQVVFDAVAWFEQEYPFEVVEKDTGEILRRFKFKDEATSWIASKAGKKEAVLVEPKAADAKSAAPMDPTALANQLTFFERLNRLATSVNLKIEGLTIAGALQAIEDELGLDDHNPPQINRLLRAEKAAGL